MDSLNLYLQEIAKIPLLTAKEEKMWARLLFKYRQAVRLWSKINANGRLTPWRERVLAHWLGREKEIKDIKERFIQANLRLVVDIAKHYLNRGLDFSDLIQEGNLGLMKAVDNFDWRMGYKFSTYAIYWIRQAISRALINKVRIIRIPVHLEMMLEEYNKAQIKLLDDLGREPSREEIAQEMGIDIKKVERLERVLSLKVISLDAPLNPSDGERCRTLSNVIKDKSIELEPQLTVPEEEVDKGLLKEKVKEILGILTPREREVIIKRFGLFGEKSHTLKEVGRKIRRTQERVRQIEKRALRKLKEKLKHPLPEELSI